jgi:hypothetical protein
MTTFIASTAAVKNNEPARHVPAICQCEEAGRMCAFCEDEAFTAWKIEQAVAELRAAVEADALAEEPDESDLAELHEWAAETTAREHLDRSAVLSLPDLIEHTADFFAAWPTAAGGLIAETLRELAAKVQATDATTPDEYRARIGVLEDEAREQHETVGYQAGLDAGREECRRKHGRTPSASFGRHPSWED